MLIMSLFEKPTYLLHCSFNPVGMQTCVLKEPVNPEI